MYTVISSPSLRPPLLHPRNPNANLNANANPNPNHLSLSLHPQTLPLRFHLPTGVRRRHKTSPARASAASFLPPGGGVEASLELLRPPVAAALAAAVKWLGVYREVLLVGVLLSWFPNIPWGRQPFAALRDLCDPFLALCREIMPPVMGRKLDLSPLVAFMVIDIVIALLRPAAGL